MHTSNGLSTLNKLSPKVRTRILAKLRELYAEDVTYFEWSQATRLLDGSAPGDARCM